MKIACDQCEKIASTEGLVGWLEIEQIGIQISTYGGARFPARLCSAECAVAYLTKDRVTA